MSGEPNNSITNQLADTFFSQFGRYFSSLDIKKNTVIPFREHAQFPILVDILSRKDNHHAALDTDFPDKMSVPFLEALLQHLALEHTPLHLRGAELIYLDITHLTITKPKQKSIEKDFQFLRKLLEDADKHLLFALTLPEDDFLTKQLESLFTHPKCRFLLFIDTKTYHQHSQLNKHFALLNIAGPTESDLLAILKQQRTELEEFHHVLIPEELLSQAYLLSERYLSTTHTLENALMLLDSSAARAGTIELNDNSGQFKPVLTTTILTNVLSHWTHIPASHLQTHKFKLSEFTQNLQQRVFGQEAAINGIAQELQQAHAHLQENTGPFCSLLLAGPRHCGKKTTALAIVEQLFKQLNIIYFLQPSLSSHTSITDAKVQRYVDKQYLPLRDIIRQIPHAVIVIENIEQASPTVLDGLQEILATGFLHDHTGNQYNFRQSILILSTTLGANRLNELAKSFTADDRSDQNLDLMQLVMSEKNNTPNNSRQHYLQHELVEEILPEIKAYLPANLHQHLHVIPFLPLTNAALENIIRLKLKILGKQLNSRYAIELGYAPEVIRYLACDIVNKQKLDPQGTMDTDKALKQLYFCVEQAILAQPDTKNRTNQLFLQLNETGQILRCEWLTISNVARQHAL